MYAFSNIVKDSYTYTWTVTNGYGYNTNVTEYFRRMPKQTQHVREYVDI